MGGWPTRLVLNLDTISTKPEKSLSGKLSEILGTCTKKAKNDEKIPQVDEMIEIKDEKSHRKKEVEGISQRKESKTKEKKSSKSDKEREPSSQRKKSSKRDKEREPSSQRKKSSKESPKKK